METVWKILYHNQVYKSLDTRYALSQMQSLEQQPLKAWNIARMRLNPSKATTDE